MSAQVLYWALLGSQLMLGAGMILAAWRMIKGPRAQDRVLSLDCLYVTAMLMLLFDR